MMKTHDLFLLIQCLADTHCTASEPTPFTELESIYLSALFDSVS